MSQTPTAHPREALLYSFWSAIDVSDNLMRALHALRGLHGMPAAIAAIPLLLMSYALAWLVLYFDVSSTYAWAVKAADKITPVIPPDLTPFAGYLIVALTLLPTLVELFSARFAAAGIAVAQIMVFVMSLFDAITDWPRVVDFCELYHPTFATLGRGGEVLFVAFRVAWLWMATFGFEMLFVVFAVSALALLRASRVPTWQRRDA
jgi:hypothetical protein